MFLHRAVEEFSAVTGVTRREGNSLLLDDAQTMIWDEYLFCVEQARKDGARITSAARAEAMEIAVARVSEWFQWGEGGHVARLAIDAHYIAAHRRQHTWAVLAGHEWRRAHERTEA